MRKNADLEVRIFPVETRFQKMAKRAGGVSREQAIERAQAKIDKIRPKLEDWLDRELQDFASLIATAHAGNAQADWIAIANFRSRQLRDVGTTMRFALLSFIADSLCELLDSVTTGGECNMDSIVCHVDALILSRQDRYRDLQPEQVPELTKGLRRVAKRASMDPMTR